MTKITDVIHSPIGDNHPRSIRVVQVLHLRFQPQPNSQKRREGNTSKHTCGSGHITGMSSLDITVRLAGAHKNSRAGPPMLDSEAAAAAAAILKLLAMETKPNPSLMTGGGRRGAAAATTSPSARDNGAGAGPCTQGCCSSTHHCSSSRRRNGIEPASEECDCGSGRRMAVRD